MREWLNAQAAGGYVEYDPASGTYTLPPEQAVALTDETSPAYLPGFFQIALGVGASTRRGSSSRPGAATGVGWHEHNHDVFDGLRAVLPARLQRQPDRRRGCRRSTASSSKLERGREGRRRRLRPRLVHDPDGGGLPALDVRRLRLPRGLDRDRARAGGGGRRRRPRAVRGRWRPQTSRATGYDLVTMFDCLHDMGDPVGAAAPRPRGDRRRRHLDDRRAEGRRPGRGQPQPGRPRLLRLLDVAVHARVAVAGGRAGAGRAGGRGADPRRRFGRRASPASGSRPRRPSTSCSRRARNPIVARLAAATRVAVRMTVVADLAPL